MLSTGEPPCCKGKSSRKVGCHAIQQRRIDSPGGACQKMGCSMIQKCWCSKVAPAPKWALLSGLVHSHRHCGIWTAPAVLLMMKSRRIRRRQVWSVACQRTRERGRGGHRAQAWCTIMLGYDCASGFNTKHRRLGAHVGVATLQNSSVMKLGGYLRQ